jgi:hypothetical protein
MFTNYNKTHSAMIYGHYSLVLRQSELMRSDRFHALRLASNDGNGVSLGHTDPLKTHELTSE